MRKIREWFIDKLSVSVSRLVLGTLPVDTMPPMCPGLSPTCWVSSAWYGRATGALSKWATLRTASPNAARCDLALTWPLLKDQAPLLVFSSCEIVRVGLCLFFGLKSHWANLLYVDLWGQTDQKNPGFTSNLQNNRSVSFNKPFFFFSFGFFFLSNG